MSDNSVETHNWIEDIDGHLPTFVKRVVKHLEAKGMDKSHAIAVSINVIKKMCRSGDTNLPGSQQVSAASRAEACKALAQWEALKARNKARDNDLHPSGATSTGMSRNFNDDELDGDTTVHAYGEPIGDVEHGMAVWARDFIAKNPTVAAKLKNISKG